MSIYLGNLRTFEKIGEKTKMLELEEKLKSMGYRNEDNCKRNTDKSGKTWHIYDIPRVIQFSVLDDSIIALLKSYSEYFKGSVGVIVP